MVHAYIFYEKEAKKEKNKVSIEKPRQNNWKRKEKNRHKLFLMFILSIRESLATYDYARAYIYIY